MADFTQYLRPYGDKKRISIYLSVEVEQMAKELTAPGADCQLEAEVLTTGQCSFTVEKEWNDDTEVLAYEICPNGPGVKDVVERLIRNAHARFFELLMTI